MHLILGSACEATMSSTAPQSIFTAELKGLITQKPIVFCVWTEEKTSIRVVPTTPLQTGLIERQYQKTVLTDPQWGAGLCWGFLSLLTQMTNKEIPVSTVTNLLAKCSLYLCQISASKRGYYSLYFHRTCISIGLIYPRNIHSPQVGTGLTDAALTAVNGNLIYIIAPM